MKKTSSTRTLEETLSQSSLLSGGSTNFSDDTLSDKLSEPIPAVRTRYRFSSALKKFRPSKSRSSSQKYTAASMKSDDEQDSSRPASSEAIRESQELSPKPAKRKNKAATLVKKLSLGAIKMTSKKSSANMDTASNRPSESKKNPEHKQLVKSVSEISLIDLDYDDGETDVQQRQHHQMQITISAKKTEKSDDQSSGDLQKQQITQSVRPSSPEPSKPERRNKKLTITESSIDIGPSILAPATPAVCAISSEFDVTAISTQPAILSPSGGAIRKSTLPKVKISESCLVTSETGSSIFMNKSGSLERGRRYPRPMDQFRTVSDLNAITSLTVSDRNDSKTISSVPSSFGMDTVDRPSIEFEVGKQVRPLSPQNMFTRGADGGTSAKAASSSFNDTIDSAANLPSREDFSSLDTTKSSESSSEPKSEGSRRRITYVAVQPDIMMPDEMPLLEAHEPLSHLSGISEYSLDSEFSLSPSSYYGDFMTDDDRVGLYV